MDTIVIGLLVLVTIILVYFTATYISRQIEYDLIKGFWTADPQFCKKSGLESFVIYFNTVKDNVCRGYIFAHHAEGIILNHPVTITFNSAYSFQPFLEFYKCLNITINWLEDEEPEYFPSKQNIHYYPTMGKMIFTTDDEVVSVVLYKDHVMTDITDHVPDVLKNNEDINDMDDDDDDDDGFI
jgi:hypothetical protein